MGFGRLLKLKCKLFLNSTKGIFIKVAIKLLLQYPLNDKYGLIEPIVYDQQHPLNKYHNKQYVENFDKNQIKILNHCVIKTININIINLIINNINIIVFKMVKTKKITKKIKKEIKTKTKQKMQRIKTNTSTTTIDRKMAAMIKHLNSNTKIIIIIMM